MHLTWRPVREEELELLLPMMAAFACGEGHGFDRERAAHNVRYLLGHPAFGGIWFICSDGAAVGYLVVTLGYSFEFGGHDSFIDEIFVLPGHRGDGIGTRSLAFAEVAAGSLGATALHLEASRREGGPIEFYARCGYVDRGYQLMTKRLATL
jgi:GNAT superfamily N-acetyltransferase